MLVESWLNKGRELTIELLEFGYQNVKRFF
jgi:hypothetical protein